MAAHRARRDGRYLLCSGGWYHEHDREPGRRRLLDGRDLGRVDWRGAFYFPAGCGGGEGLRAARVRAAEAAEPVRVSKTLS